MAKLNVEIEIEGVKYRKVDRKAAVGDVLKITDNDDYDYVIEGAFYEVTRVDVAGDPHFEDEDGDDFDGGKVEYEVYEKNEESAQPPKPKRLTVGDYAKVVGPNDNDHTYEIGSVIKIVEGPEDLGSRVLYVGERADGTRGNYLRSYHLQPATEAEFLAQVRFKVGDYVKVVDADCAKSIAEVGDIGEVTNDNWGGGSFGSHTIIDVKTLDGRKYGMFAYRFVRATEAEVAAAQREAKEAIDPRSQFAKGDKVRLISGGGTLGLFDYETGGIYTVGDPKPGNTSEKVQITGGGQPTAYAKPDQLEKVSAEEVAEIEKWAAIGRKVGEFKRGDVVEAKRSLGSSDWIYGKVEDEPRIQSDGELLMGLRIPSGYYYAVYVKDAKLVVPVEQRFDREEKAAA